MSWGSSNSLKIPVENQWKSSIFTIVMSYENFLFKKLMLIILGELGGLFKIFNKAQRN